MKSVSFTQRIVSKSQLSEERRAFAQRKRSRNLGPEIANQTEDFCQIPRISGITARLSGVVVREYSLKGKYSGSDPLRGKRQVFGG